MLKPLNRGPGTLGNCKNTRMEELKQTKVKTHTSNDTPATAQQREPKQNISSDLKIDLLPYPSEMEDLLRLLKLSGTKSYRKTGERVGDKIYSAVYASFNTPDDAAREYLRLAAAGFNVAFNCKIGAAFIPAVETVLFVNGIGYSVPIDDFRAHVKANSRHVSSVKYYIDEKNTFTGKGFIKFSSKSAAEDCVTNLNCTFFSGHKLLVFMSNKQHKMVSGALSADTPVAPQCTSEPSPKRLPAAASTPVCSNTCPQDIQPTESTELFLSAFMGRGCSYPLASHLYMQGP